MMSMLSEAMPEEPKPVPFDLSAIYFDKMKAIKPQAEEPPVSSLVLVACSLVHFAAASRSR